MVCDKEDKVVGWIALSLVSSRCVYKGLAEVSVYVAENHRRTGVGDLLLKTLISRSEQLGIWTLQAQMFPENQSSINLHIKNGFRIVGTRKMIGKMTYGRFKGEWKDNVLLERRSQVIGI